MRATTLLFLLLVGVAVSTVNSASIQKRFFVKDIQKYFKKAFDKIKDRLGDVKESFSQALAKLEKYASSDETQAQCEATCFKHSTNILQVADEKADAMCSPLCDALLDKISDIVG